MHVFAACLVRVDRVLLLHMELYYLEPEADVYFFTGILIACSLHLRYFIYVLK